MGRRKGTATIIGGTGTYTTLTIIGKMIGFSIKTTTPTTTFKVVVDDTDGFRWYTKRTTTTGRLTHKHPSIQCNGPLTFTFTSVSVDEDIDIVVTIENNASFLG